ncbi:YHYH domain-containing protein [Tistrella mobilis]|uniref:YHYH domain-containing protein n=1 Tax=Tistrella mobilis TaxID=171437 RepID=UPI0035570CFD
MRNLQLIAASLALALLALALPAASVASAAASAMPALPSELTAPPPAHGGGLDRNGCHHNRKTGDYHCH